MAHYKKISIIWIGYLLFIFIVTFILQLSGLIAAKEPTIKELFFALWGYSWDGMHYIRIATHGYHFPLQAFFPLYPLIIKSLDYILPLTLAYRVNILIFLLMLFVLYSFQIKLGFDRTKSVTNLFLLLCLPTAFFLQANYTEALFILISALLLMCLLDKKYVTASLFGVLLTAVKISGIAIVPVIFAAYILDTGYSNYKNYLRALFFSAIPLLGILAYFVYLQTQFGTYTIFFKSQAEWGRVIGNGATGLLGYFVPIIKALRAWDISIYRRLSELVAVITAVWLLFKSWNRLPRVIWLYCLIQVLVPITTGSFLSFNRLILLAYPLLLFGFNLMASKKVIIGYAVVSIGLQVFFIYLFLSGVFIG